MASRAASRSKSASAPGTEERQKFYRRLARRAGLRYVTDTEPGITRRPHGRGFAYYYSGGRRVGHRRQLERIESLVIPPAWTEVWICKDPKGHLQVTGRDDRGRKQYLYHEKWRAAADRLKFDRMVEVGELLPKIRRRVRRDLRRRELSKEVVAALVVRLLDLTAARVGNLEYARDNASYGLTTLRDSHVKVSGDRVQFAFNGKSGKRHEIELKNRRLATLISRCRDLPDRQLFQYETDEGRRPLTSDDVNEYLARITDGAVTAKDFRTWHASALVASMLAEECDGAPDERACKRACKSAIQHAAALLGNTATVCGKYYVHTGIVDSYMAGQYARVTARFSVRRSRWYRTPEQLLLHVLNEIAG